ncbi:MAG: electron transfer flavoprotein subunit alpha [Desulfuromonadales bacterium GWD2_61_12]|nr:MAG: electron transfer flavoprotein subunit alpha [Desulfuromonadales bacterium GWC2_61_20]OGR32009.1 MAG: electron transfer flavoprotein subunit alpha [Desulfuromonadales bacterium GWD2_61_12]HAD04457.1 electron transfer flavoprotein subunit alpha/FixB family protein [Desulfuromonas sp.]HBT84044.1 electron transfer flavoprotein subunit alpha/FixB family protein [Desulfuromonas sp.]
MKVLLVGEYRDGKILPSTYETVAFARKLGAAAALFLVADPSDLPRFAGKLYLAAAQQCGEYNPEGHLALLLQAVQAEEPDFIVFLHSAYGWDLAPRLALALDLPQISEVVALAEGAFVVPACNGKLRRTLRPLGQRAVLTLQSGAFNADGEPAGTPQVAPLTWAGSAVVELVGYEAASRGAVDLSRAEIIVSAGRGIGKPENLALIEGLATVLGGEVGASRPVVDAGWAPHERQVGSTGQTVAPKLYIACGISGAVQHLAGMKKSGFVVAINTDGDAPIGEVADVLVVADLKQFVPLLTGKLGGV